MKKIIPKFLGVFIFFSTITSVNAMTKINYSTIICWDTNANYIEETITPFRKEFFDDYVSSNDLSEYKRAGYSYVIASKNCGLEEYSNFPKYEVLYLFEKKNDLREIVDWGKFSVYESNIRIYGALDLKHLKSDLILEGDSKKFLRDSQGSSIHGKLNLGRGTGKVKMIIRRIEK